MSIKNKFWLGMGVIVLLSVTGCTAIGPTTVARDRFDYSTAISDSWKKVMLMNLVKMRYGDAPTFLEVSSVINQYSLEGQIELGAKFSGGLLGDSQTVGGTGKYADRPTITYNPLMGERFAKALLTPLPPSALLSLIQSGWSAEFLFRVGVSAINGIYSRSSARLSARGGDPEFEVLIDFFTRIQDAGGMGMRIEKKNKETHTMLIIRRKLDEKLAQDVAELRRLLGLNPEAFEFRVSYGSFARDDQEIAILTRSMLQVTAELAAHVEVPAQDIEDNIASPGFFDRIISEEEKRSRVRIRSAEEKPVNAFVAIHYQNHWFYIDNRDYKSKRTFSFLLFLFTLTEPGAQKGPAITIPTG
jgi:hypothetical protein